MDDRQIGYEVTAVAAGIDAFERGVNKGQGIIGDEGLIPLYLGADLIEAKKYSAWQEVGADIERIGALVDETPETPRKMFLTKLVESLRMAAHLFKGGEAEYREKLNRLVGIPAEPIDGDFIAGLGDLLEGKLSEAGFGKGSLKERIMAWEGASGIPQNDIKKVFTELMLEARDRTDSMIGPTDGYLMELNPVKGMHYTARCNFSERKMDLNVGNTFTRSAMKHLVAHEIFPGHSTQNIYTLRSFKEGDSTADVLLCSLNGITGVIQEGIGDQGVELIDWIEDENDEIEAVLRRYRSAVATQAAWMLNVEGVPEDKAADYMRNIGVMQEARVAGRIGMARHPFRGPFIASYFYGNEAVRRVRRAVEGDREKREAFIRDLYGNMHSPESLCSSNGVAYRSYGDN